MAKQVGGDTDRTGTRTRELGAKDSATTEHPNDFQAVLPSTSPDLAGPLPVNAADAPDLAAPNPGQNTSSAREGLVTL